MRLDCSTILQTPRINTWPIFRRPIAHLVLGLALASVALAQQAKPDFATISKTELKEIDRNNVAAWISQQMQQLFAATDDAALQKQGLEFVQTVRDSLKDPAVNAKFREGMATLIAESFVKQYKAAPATRRPLAAPFSLMPLEAPGLPLPAVIDAYKLALGDTKPAGRLVAASGLRVLRDKLTDAQWSDLLPVIQKAASAETNDVALGHMYRFLAVGPGPRLQAAIPVVMEILEARLKRFAQKGWPVPADAEVAKWLGPKVATLPNAQQQNQGTLIMARLMTYAVYAYVNKPGENFIEPLERVIVAAEAQLKDIVTRRAAGTQAPSVTTRLLEKVPPDNNAILLDLNKWIGTAQQEGVLNKQPFGFDRGLKIAPPAASRPAGTTKPTPG